MSWMTDLLTPDEVRKIQKDVQKKFSDDGWIVIAVDRDTLEGLCADYLKIWDRNEELEAVIKKELVGRLDELKQAVLDD